MGHSSIGILYGVYTVCSIGGMYGVLLYWRAVWGMAQLVGCMGYSSIDILYGVYNVCSIGGMYGV